MHPDMQLEFPLHPAIQTFLPDSQALVQLSAWAVAANNKTAMMVIKSFMGSSFNKTFQYGFGAALGLPSSYGSETAQYQRPSLAFAIQHG
jgi:hypothetical protein